MTHTLALVRSIARDVAVMCDGVIVERSETENPFTADPYTISLLKDVPGV